MRSQYQNIMPKVKRQAWVDVYDKKTGRHVPKEEMEGQLSDQAQEMKTSNKAAEKAIDQPTEHPQRDGHDLPQVKSVNDNASEKPSAPNDGDKPTNSVPITDEVQPKANLEDDTTGIGFRRWKSRWGSEDDPWDVQYSDYTNLHGSKQSSILVPKVLDISANGIMKPDTPDVPIDTANTSPVTASQTNVVSGAQAESTAVKDQVIERDFRNQFPEQTWRDPFHVPTISQRGARWEELYAPPSDVSPPMPVYVETYIKHWARAAHDVLVDLHPEGIEEPEKCDIDTETGLLMDPVECRIADKADEHQEEVDEGARVAMKNALREATKLEEATEREEALKKEIELETAPKGSFSLTWRAERRQNAREIKMPCHLRPALRADLEQIAAIYNNEIKASYKLPDKSPVTVYKWCQILENCISHNLPFLVAVNGWHSEKRSTGRVIGFAMTDVVTRGIFGSYTTHASSCGKVTVVVHPDYRRMNVCSALLDAILYFTSPQYVSRRGYEIVNPMSDRRYMVPKHNLRQWHSIDIEIVIPSKNSKDETKNSAQYQWITTYLQNYFDMHVVYHDEKLYRDVRYENLWLDRVTVRHQCREPGARTW